MTHTSLPGNASRISLIAVVLLAVYLGGFALLRTNCEAPSGALVVLPQRLWHQKCLLAEVVDDPFGDGSNRLRWLIVAAYHPLLQLDMKLTKRTYLRSPLWSGEVIEPWF